MRVVCLGELLIDFVANESGVTVGEASGFEKKPGGAPANVAVAVRKLGHDSTFLTQVGDDPFGHYLAGVLKDEGVDTSGISYSQTARTALAFVSLAADGERDFMFYRHPSADMLMTEDDLKLDLLDNADIFHFGSITLIDDPARTATLAAAQTAIDRGLLVSYDPKPAPTAVAGRRRRPRGNAPRPGVRAHYQAQPGGTRLPRRQPGRHLAAAHANHSGYGRPGRRNRPHPRRQRASPRLHRPTRGHHRRGGRLCGGDAGGRTRKRRLHRPETRYGACSASPTPPARWPPPNAAQFLRSPPAKKPTPSSARTPPTNNPRYIPKNRAHPTECAPSYLFSFADNTGVTHRYLAIRL